MLSQVASPNLAGNAFGRNRADTELNAWTRKDQQGLKEGPGKQGRWGKAEFAVWVTKGNHGWEAPTVLVKCVLFTEATFFLFSLLLCFVSFDIWRSVHEISHSRNHTAKRGNQSSPKHSDFFIPTNFSTPYFPNPCLYNQLNFCFVWKDAPFFLAEQIIKWKCSSLGPAQLFTTPWTIAHQAPLVEDSRSPPGKNTGVGCRSLLQGIFPTQGSNLGLLQILYHLSHQGSPNDKFSFKYYFRVS